ncbi:flagellar filament capping protein FliD [Paenibacillus cisolokensis]|uniref:flagellar filament capping protein FliD n=1 Tax=Paenibacillus cisolokensis TaxID=1658519 RepID=UPI003555CCA5
MQSEKSIFQSINTKLNTLKTAVSDLLLNANFNLVSGKSTNEGVVKLKTAEGTSTGNYNIAVTQLAQSHSIKSKSLDPAGTTLQGTTLKIGSVEITVGDEMTDGEALEYIKNQINSKDTGLTAAVVSDSDNSKVLVLTSKETGAQNKMVLSSTDDGILLEGTALSALDITDIADNGQNTIQKAQDAKFTVNGLLITRSSNNISGVIDGVTLELVAAGSSQVTVARDTDKIAEKSMLSSKRTTMSSTPCATTCPSLQTPRNESAAGRFGTEDDQQ